MSAAPAVFDNHLYIIGPRLPLVSNQGWGVGLFSIAT